MCDLAFGPEGRTLMALHTGGTIRFTTRDGQVETKTFAPKDTRFIARGTIDAEEALEGTPRAVTIELR